jgi:hypothetical protein
VSFLKIKTQVLKKYIFAIVLSVLIALLRKHVEIFTIEQLRNVSFVFLAVLLTLYGICSSLTSDVILKIFRSLDVGLKKKEDQEKLTKTKESVKAGFTVVLKEVYNGILSCFVICIYSYSHGVMKYSIVKLLNNDILSYILPYLQFLSYLITTYAFIVLFIIFIDVMKTLKSLNEIQIKYIK